MKPADLAAAYVEACRLDVAVLKPGNVSVAAPGHGMHAADFLASAEVSAPWLTGTAAEPDAPERPDAGPGSGLGARVLGAVRATQRAARCNTNLGIVLLCAPLIMARERGPGALRQRVHEVLAELTPADARAVYQAIAEAAPGGLGRAPEADVRGPAPASLVSAMALAAERDLVARQYATCFEDVLSFGVPTLESARLRWGSTAAAVQQCYLGWLCRELDSHTLRKFGLARAEWLRSRALEVASRCKACENSDQFQPLLVAFDRELKSANVNPGTTADLTVASLLALALSREPV